MRPKGSRIILLILILWNCSQLFTQDEKPANKKVWCLDSLEVEQVRKDYAKLAHLEEKDSLQHQRDSVVNARLIDKEERINNLQIELLGKDEQIELFKQREARLEIPPVLKWRGFFPGISFEYRFDSEVITQQTIIAGLKYDLAGSFKVEALGRLDLTGQVVIPLRKESFGLKVFVEYRAF